MKLDTPLRPCVLQEEFFLVKGGRWWRWVGGRVLRRPEAFRFAIVHLVILELGWRPIWEVIGSPVKVVAGVVCQGVESHGAIHLVCPANQFPRCTQSPRACSGRCSTSPPCPRCVSEGT